jgi:hypothetical protein
MTDKKIKINTLKFLKKHRNFSVIFILIFAFCVFSKVEAASLFISPSSGTYTVGQTFNVSVYVSSIDQAMNAVSANLNFPSDILQVTSLSKTGSIITNWVQEPNYSNTNGTISLEGIVLNPGYQGYNGKILTISFKAKAIGEALISFNSSTVLANDGLGTNILTNVSSANFTIEAASQIPVSPKAETPTKYLGTPQAPEIISSTHPDPNKWYKETTAQFSWKITDDISQDAVVIDQNPRTIPSKVYTPPITFKEVNDLPEGISYIHVQLKNSYGWGDVSHFRIQIDKTPPDNFIVKVDNEGDPTNPQPILKFKASDALSGIDYYEIKIGDLSKINVSSENITDSGFKIPVTPPGKYSVIIKAVDKAGNYSFGVTDLTISPIEEPIITEYPKRLDPGAPLVAKGISNICKKVILFLQNERKEIIQNEGDCENGHFVATLNRTLENGVYNLWLQAVDSRGAFSNYTKPKTIIVSPPVFIQIGNLLIPYLSVIITLTALVIFLIILSLYGYRKINHLKRVVTKETKEAQTALFESFNNLRNEISSLVSQIDGKPGLSKKEQKILDELKEILNKTEEKVSKEIKDIKEKI